VPHASASEISIIIKKKSQTDNEVHCAGAHPLYDALKQQGLNSIKPAQDQRRPAQLTASTFNQADHYASSPGT